jgi:DNA-binding IclR family transcriptional regulator
MRELLWVREESQLGLGAVAEALGRPRLVPDQLERLEAELAVVRADTPVSEHGEFRDGVSCTAALVPRRAAEEPAWAVVVAVAAEDVPDRITSEVALAAADLAGSATR